MYKLIRKPILLMLKIFSCDFHINHHFTKKKFILNLYNHKGY
jgi:hypothetical protein